MSLTFFKNIIIRPARVTLTCLFFSTFSLSTTAQAGLTIEISDSFENALPIAIVPFGYDASIGQTGMKVPLPVDLAEVISSDLRRSGRFKPVAESRMPSKPTEVEQLVFDQWRSLDVDNLLMGKVVDQGNGFYQIDIRLMDVLRKNQLIGKRWTQIPQASLRQVAHQISDLIYQELTGIRGAFNTQIAYVMLRKNNGKRLFTLEIADADGFNPQAILKSNQPIMSPTWSPDGRKLAYVSFEKGRSMIVVQSLDGSSRKIIAQYKGINGAPAWSPDGQKLALTLSKDGSADIYILDMNTQNLRRVTNHGAIETESVWAPDGKSLYFNSDRRGQPQIFQVFLDSGQVERISYEGRYNSNPDVSPDGRYVAMVHGNGGFNVALQDTVNNKFTILTNTFLDESPSFSPNGEMILYAASKGGKGILAVVSVDGKASQVLKVNDGEVREPAWGPFVNR